MKIEGNNLAEGKLTAYKPQLKNGVLFNTHGATHFSLKLW